MKLIECFILSQHNQRGKMGFSYNTKTIKNRYEKVVIYELRLEHSNMRAIDEQWNWDDSFVKMRNFWKRKFEGDERVSGKISV